MRAGVRRLILVISLSSASLRAARIDAEEVLDETRVEVEAPAAPPLQEEDLGTALRADDSSLLDDEEEEAEADGSRTEEDPYSRDPPNRILEGPLKRSSKRKRPNPLIKSIKEEKKEKEEKAALKRRKKHSSTPPPTAPPQEATTTAAAATTRAAAHPPRPKATPKATPQIHALPPPRPPHVERADAIAAMKLHYNTTTCARTARGYSQNALGCKANCGCEGFFLFVSCYPKRLPYNDRYVDVGVCEMSLDAFFVAAFLLICTQVLIFMAVMQSAIGRLPLEQRAALVNRGRGGDKELADAETC